MNFDPQDSTSVFLTEIDDLRTQLDSFSHHFQDHEYKTMLANLEKNRFNLIKLDEINRKLNKLPELIANIIHDHIKDYHQRSNLPVVTLDSMRKVIEETFLEDKHNHVVSSIKNSIDEITQDMNEMKKNRVFEDPLNPPLNPSIKPIKKDVINESNLSFSIQDLPANVYLWPDYDENGGFHRVPFGFKWPIANISTIWKLWHLGDSLHNIVSYKLICRKIDLIDVVCKMNYSKTKIVMKRMIALAIQEQLIKSESDINEDNNQIIYNHVMPIFMLELYPKPCKCPLDLNVNTALNRMQRNKRINSNNIVV
jgi:hypothetical protein